MPVRLSESTSLINPIRDLAVAVIPQSGISDVSIPLLVLRLHGGSSLRSATKAGTDSALDFFPCATGLWIVCVGGEARLK